MALKELLIELDSLKNGRQAKNLQWFFKTGKGQYGEGDIFLGIKVPVLRGVSKKYNLSLDEIQKLLKSKIHEHRMIGLFILLKTYQRSDEKGKKEIAEFYLKNSKRINNWDLVDLSAPRILGDYLLDKDRKVLYRLARSDNLWERRISILSTSTFISKKDFCDSLRISEILLKDEHDLMHKAVGWMLREIGKRDERVLENFLDKHYKVMPRTMLRYSIERLSKSKREHYMQKPTQRHGTHGLKGAQVAFT